MIIGLCSTYREGQLGAGAIRSTRSACDMVAVFEGPVGNSPETGDPTPLKGMDRLGVIVKHGEWESDAAKRTAMLEWARGRFWTNHDEPLWVVWIDGDEILVWGEYLRDWLTRAEHVEGAYNWRIRLVELDGSTALCAGKCIRGDMIKRYLVSSYQVELFHNKTVVALPNEPNWFPCETKTDPDTGKFYVKDSPITAINRPPLQGEPHILHRSGLRPPTRTIGRLHDAEAEWFPEALKAAGLEGVEEPSERCSIGGSHVKGPHGSCVKCGGPMQ